MLVVLVGSAVLAACSPGTKITIRDPMPFDAERSPDWSPDGRSIVFSWNDASNWDSGGVYVLELDTGIRRPILSGGSCDHCEPDWSPSGEWIAMVGLTLVRSSGDSSHRLTSALGFSPSWSPDGARIAMSSGADHPNGPKVIWTVAADGSDARDISEHGVGEWLSADWSPDGGRLVHVRYVGVGWPEIFVMDTSGANAARLTNDNVSDGNPAWSPDGLWIAWSRNDPGSRPYVWVMRADGTSARRLTEGFDPTWSPDGGRIAFSAFVEDGSLRLHVANLDGSGRRRLMP